MQVGVDELIVFGAGGANAAGVVFHFVFAINIGGIGQGQGKIAAARRAQKKLGMSNMIVLYGLNKRSPYSLQTW